VEALLATALAKEPARRFPTARELRRELHELRVRLGRPGIEESGPVSRQRRQLVLLSCQLTGLEGLTGRLDAEDLGELQAGFHQECEEVIRRHGGSVNLSMGGEVFACFGCPQVREDDAERAVRAALLLAHVVPESLQRRLSHLSLSGLGTKVGLHTDQMVLDTRALQGDAPRVASWLAGQAGTGEVLASEATWGQVRGAFETERLGARDFAGLTGPAHVEVHRVLREQEVRVRFERTLVAGGLTPLVGRERELRQLLALWERAREGQGAFVLVRGEAGIGKSRLLEELRERVPAETALRLRFQCWSRLGASALPPVVEVLQQLLPLSPGGSPQRQLGEVEAQLVAMGLDAERVQLLALLLSLPVPKSAPVYRLTPERRQEESYKALVELLLCVARRRPVLAVVEDLHWADSSWLEFLGWLLERVEAERLLVVLSARPEFQSSWPARPGFHPLTLERLPAGLAAALVKEVAKGSELPEATVQHLVAKTDGIPLFIEEMTRMALAGGEVASIPVTLHELLLARLDLLPSRQKALAQLGAVVGRDFSLALLAALTELEPTDLRRELTGLVEAGLLQEVREGPDAPGYQFRHALFQEAAYQSLPRGERRAHHRHIARVLEERFPAVVEARPEALAHHLTEVGEHARALGHWERAGQLALLRQALPEAVGHLTRALELLPALADAEQRLQRELKIRVPLGLSMAEVRGYGAPEVERMIDRAWELIERVGEALPRLDLFYWGIFSFYWRTSRYPQGNAFAQRLLDLGQRQGNPALLGLGHQMRAILHFSCGRPREAAEEFERTLEGMEPLPEEQRSLAMEYWGEPRTLALAFTALVHAMLGRVEASRRYGQEALDRAGRVAHPSTLIFAQVVVAAACVTRLDAQEALALADRALEISSTRGILVWRAWATQVRASALVLLGRPREGLALALGELEALRAQGQRTGVPSCLSTIAMSHLALGQVREALASVDEALVLSAATGESILEAWLHQLRGESLRRLGREEEARACFARALSVAHEQGAGLDELSATVSLCRQLGDTGSTGEARRLLEEAVERFEPGGDCVDLQEARALLARLAGGGGPST
jgi:class 3 adenylate cyclase/tetratricopeptide (TPR) repeat protein